MTSELARRLILWGDAEGFEWRCEACEWHKAADQGSPDSPSIQEMFDKHICEDNPRQTPKEVCGH